MKIIAE
jgi:hypothetical protein